MKGKLAAFLSLVVGFLIFGIPLLAHHGTAVSYNIHKVIILKGKVTQFAFSNPHSQLYFNVTDDKGKVTQWAAEMRNPRNLQIVWPYPEGTQSEVRARNADHGHW